MILKKRIVEMSCLKCLALIYAGFFCCILQASQYPTIKEKSAINLNVASPQLRYIYNYPGYGSRPDGRKESNQSDCLSLKFSKETDEKNISSFLSTVEVFDGFDVLLEKEEREHQTENFLINTLEKKRLNSHHYVFKLKDLNTYMTGIKIQTKNKKTLQQNIFYHFSPLPKKIYMKLLRTCPLF